MSDRNARPEWRAAYLNRTVTPRTLREAAGAGAPAKRRRDAERASPALPIAAMLQLLPSA